MNPLTPVVIEVGKAAAKAIFKIWVKDSALDSISSDLIDLIAKKTSDTLAQRKGERQFEEIGDKVCETILPLFEAEGIRVDEGERAEVARAVAITLNKANLSGEILLVQNLQPVQLEKYVLNQAPADITRDLNSVGISLYYRIIHECCIYIVNISSQLPSFTQHTFATILQRTDLILDRANEMFRELRKISESLDLTKKADNFEREYRDAVARNLDIIQLIGADVSLPNRRHKLSVAYIMLSASHEPSYSSDNFSPSEKESIDEFSQDSVPVDVALATSQRLIIKGSAGSGKTTLLQWIAVKAARKGFENKLEGWNGLIPFYIRLRHYTQMRLPSPEAFPEFAAPAIVGTMPKEWVHTVLREGRAILLVDGVDEVSASQREEVHSWLKDLVATYKDCRFIVTSRPHAIEDGWLREEAFSETTLQEMTLSDIYLFIDHWHEAVKQELLSNEEKNELNPLAEHLKTQITQTRTIRNLATNPLLCAMLCALHRDRRRQLPVNRIELYNACCSLLLERREKESRIDLSDYPSLTYSQKLRLLTDLAYWMIRENLSEAKTVRVDNIFVQKLANMTNIQSDISAQAVRRMLVERSGIIREPIYGKIDFTHRTFQEFFAAQAVLDSGDIKYLIENSHLDQWREVIILAAGLAPQKLCEQLIEGLVNRGDHEKERRYQLHLLAISCLETAIEVEPTLRAELDKRLSQLVPPRNITDAKDLASAGELAIKHLDKRQLLKKKKNIGTICVACIRTLALIGGELALDMLEDYASDTREKVIDELIKDWDRFDKTLYAKRVLSKSLQSRASLRLNGVSVIDGIEYLSHLIKLYLSNCSNLTNINAVAALTQLTSLDLSDCQSLSDLSPLATLTNLTNLDLSHNDSLSDVSPLATLTNLTRLDLSHNDSLSGLSYIIALTGTKIRISYSQLINTSLKAVLTELTSLNLSDNKLTDLSSLSELTKLTSLDLSGCSSLTDLNPLATLTNLTNLDLSSCYNLIILSPLATLTNLTNLDLSGCHGIRDFSPLTDLTNLTNLDLSACHSLKNLNPLATLTKLTNLDLSLCNKLIDLNPLKALTNLTSLDLSYCYNLTDLSPLAMLTNLTSLNLSGNNKLIDLSPLIALTNLTSLDLSHCDNLADLSPLAAITDLTIKRQ